MYITNINFKYNLKKLRKVTDEYKFVKDFFDTCRCKNLLDVYHLKEMSIYRLIEEPKTRLVNANNLMLFHGTSFEGATGILKEGLFLFLPVEIVLCLFIFVSED